MNPDSNPNARAVSDLDPVEPQQDVRSNIPVQSVRPTIQDWKIEVGDAHLAKPNVEACRALVEKKHYDGSFASEKVPFEETPVSILSKPDLNVTLMVHYQKRAKVMSDLDVDMTVKNVHRFLESLAEFGTGYLAYFNLGAYTVVFRFVESKSVFDCQWCELAHRI